MTAKFKKYKQKSLKNLQHKKLTVTLKLKVLIHLKSWNKENCTRHSHTNLFSCHIEFSFRVFRASAKNF